MGSRKSPLTAELKYGAKAPNYRLVVAALDFRAHEGGACRGAKAGGSSSAAATRNPSAMELRLLR